MACEALPEGAGFIGSMVRSLDCQAQLLGTGAWQALALPGSTLSIVLSGFLTIFIAIIGYNLLLGQGPTVRSGTLACVKIGAVLALATAWPAYKTLVFDLVIEGPGQLVSEIGPQAGLSGSDGTLLQRLDLADRALAQLTLLGPGAPASNQVLEALPPFAGFNAFALGGARILFLITAIAGIAAVRIVAGLMLAMGPLFIAFIMFDNTRSLFEGWVRVLAGAALAMVGVLIVLGLELALLEPWLSAVLARRMAGEALPTLPSELFVIIALFAILVVAGIVASARVARTFRLAPVARAVTEQVDRPSSIWQSREHSRSERTGVVESERTRAAEVASAVLAMNRRELAAASVGPSVVPAALARGATADTSSRRVVPLGQSFSRRTTSRVSARAHSRDTGK